MGAIDLGIVILSLLALLAFAGWLARRQRSTADYYLGGRHLPAWALGASLAANQVSAVSLVGAPAFVAMREGGGLLWLQYELAVPLAMALLVVFGVPVLRRAKGADVYGAVETRLGRGARRTLAGMFLLGRGLGAGVILYTSALVVAACSGWELGTSLVVVGLVAIAYTTLGGLVADVFSDVLQLVLLWGGTIVATIVLGVRLAGTGALGKIDTSRLVPIDAGGTGLGDGVTFGFLPMLLGGLFLYLSYYGCDQTQAQRILAARDERSARKALTVAALVRFPLVLTYCLFGVLLAGLLIAEPDFAQRVAAAGDKNALVPEFLVAYLPVGVLGIAVAGILAAALSSIDSALNSLSAVTLEEFMPGVAKEEGRRSVLTARGLTVAWGVWATLTGWWFSQAGETVIESVNKVGSLFYGPILALFVLAWRSRRADGRSAVIGALAGVAVNLVLSETAPSVSWLWWNVSGCLTALVIGHGFGRGSQEAPAEEETAAPARGYVVTLVVTFAVVLGLLGVLTAVFGS
ncbi:MAG: hypothetical protein QNJ90_01980 [Planctomycetota bacterium]|nr:hypothetical protein [Planctomycetota bacterium]